MSKTCIILGYDPVADAIRDQASLNADQFEFVSWRGCFDRHARHVTMQHKLRIGRFNEFIPALKKRGVDKILAAGAPPPSSKIELSPQLRDKAMSASRSHHIADITEIVMEEFLGNGIRFVGLHEIFPELCVHQYRHHELSAIDKQNVSTLYEELIAQIPFNVTRSGVFDGTELLLSQKQTSTQQLLTDFLEEGYTAKQQLSLVKVTYSKLAGIVASVVGPQTIRLCKAAGISRIALGTSNSILLKPEKSSALLNDYGISLTSAN